MPRTACGRRASPDRCAITSDNGDRGGVALADLGQYPRQLRWPGGDGISVDGIASERDIVRALAQRGAAVLSEPVTAIYTAEVHTVTPQTPIEEVMRMMTKHRVRHAPVVVDGALRGIVSIGDVVGNRIDELETERVALTDYITGTR